uniref:Uncharacterized protein n=1 Tax=Ditylenchus dipsaci TaxID=166011 RepID=A0A915E7Z3_9BILA
MFELLNRVYWKNYIKVLKPVADMVLDLQGEKLPSTQGHWTCSNNLAGTKVSMEPFDETSFGVALANAAMEAFERKIGNLNDSNWVNSFSGRLNKKVIACSVPRSFRTWAAKKYRRACTWNQL